MSQNDASPVASTAEFRMRRDMHNAPHGKLLLLINEGGKLTTGQLTRDTLSHFIEWQYCPKRALPENLYDDDEAMDCGCDE